MTPFWVIHHYHLVIQFKPPKTPSNLRLVILADATVSGMDETHWLLRETLLEAQVRQSKYTGSKDVTCEARSKVLLSTRHFQITRLSQKLDYKRTGPYTVSKMINQNAYKLDSLKTIRNHKVFHMS
jgi:hypothetical protein